MDKRIKKTYWSENEWKTGRANENMRDVYWVYVYERLRAKLKDRQTQEGVGGRENQPCKG